MLVEINRAPVSPKAHCAALESLATPISVLLAKLRGEYAGFDGGFGEPHSRAARLHYEIGKQLTFGYRFVADQWAEAPWLERRLSQRLGTVSAHRLLFFGLQVVITAKLLAVEPFAGLWQILHRGYQRARAAGGHQDRQDYPGFQGYEAISIEGCYQCALLATLLPLQRLGQVQIAEILASLACWAARLQLRDCRENGDHHSLASFLVECDRDAPPLPARKFCADCVGGGCWLLDTRELDAYFVELLMAAEDRRQERVALPGGIKVSRDTLGALKAILSPEAAEQGAFLSRLADVTRWVNSLHLANARDSTRQVYLLLKDAKRSQIPYRQRLEFLERLAGPLATIFANLRRHYREPVFPLPEKSLKVALLVNEMAELLAANYEKVLSDPTSATWLLQHAVIGVGMWETAAHRAFYYSFLLAVDCQRLQLPYPEGFWLRLHRLYQTAVRHGRQRRAVAVAELEGYGQLSIEQYYKKLLLLARIPLYRIKTSQIDPFRCALDLLLDLVPLRGSAAEERAGTIALHIDPHLDQGPEEREAANPAPQAACLILDTSRLVTELEGRLMRAEALNEDRVALGREVELDADTLEVMRDAWMLRPPRREERKSLDTPVEALFSLTAICYHLGAVAGEPLEPPSPPGGAEEGEAPFVVEEIDYQTYDPWGTIYSEQKEQGIWRPRVDTSGFVFFHGRLKDYSKGGCRLLLEPAETLRLRVGGLVGVRHRTTLSIVGYIRWIETGPRLCLGIRFLATNIRAGALVSAVSQRRGMWLPCLLGEYVENARPILIAPNMPGLRHQALHLLQGDQRSLLASMGFPLAQSQDFEAFSYELAPPQRPEARPGAAEPGALVGERQRAGSRSVWDML